MVTQVYPWLVVSAHVFSIGVLVWIRWPRNISSHHCCSNTRNLQGLQGCHVMNDVQYKLWCHLFMMVVFMCLVHSFFVVVNSYLLIHIVLCVQPTRPRFIVYVRHDHRWMCINANMQPCGSNSQQVVATIQNQNDLSIWTHSEGFDPSLHVDWKLQVMVKRWVH
jgi:hypothetical protein